MEMHMIMEIVHKVAQDTIIVVVHVQDANLIRVKVANHLGKR
jgi:hypothetical protein